MKDLPIIVVTSILILGGCSQTSNVSPTASPLSNVAQPSSNVDKNLSFPKTSQETCGDSLPEGIEAYPVSFYPIFVDYSEEDFTKIRQHFCKDAVKIFRKKEARNFIQVASFTSEERANRFKEKLSIYFKKVDIGVPTILEGKVHLSKAQVLSKKALIKAARLTPKQVTQLDTKVGTGKDFFKGSVVIIPSYLPDDYRILYFWVTSASLEDTKKYLQILDSQNYAGRYRIIYSNPEGRCFFIDGGLIAPIGDNPYDYPKSISLKILALGEINIGYDVFDRGDEIRSIGLQHAYKLLRGANEYRFGSSSYTDTVYSSDGSSRKIICKTMKLKEAVKVIQSLYFLNP